MDDANGAVAAALVSGVVVAGTFTATEIIKFVTGLRRQRVNAVLQFVTALGRVPLDSARRLSRWHLVRKLIDVPDFDISAAGMRLYTALPRRHWELVRWIGWRLTLMADASPFDRVEIAADLSATDLGYLASPRRALGYIRRDSAAVDAWFHDA